MKRKLIRLVERISVWFVQVSSRFGRVADKTSASELQEGDLIYLQNGYTVGLFYIKHRSGKRVVAQRLFDIDLWPDGVVTIIDGDYTNGPGSFVYAGRYRSLLRRVLTFNPSRIRKVKA